MRVWVRVRACAFVVGGTLALSLARRAKAASQSATVWFTRAASASASPVGSAPRAAATRARALGGSRLAASCAAAWCARHSEALCTSMPPAAAALAC